MATTPIPTAATRMVKPIETAGEDIITSHCDNYFHTESNHLLPPIITSAYPELRDPATEQVISHPRRLTSTEKAQLHGLNANQGGEISEYDVYRAFHQLSSTSQLHPFLLLHELTSNDEKEIILNELIKELPHFPSNVKTTFEFDYVILVKHVGIIHVEVKASLNTEAMTKAEIQLTTGEIFFSALMEAIQQEETVKQGVLSHLPYIRVIVIPNEASPSPTIQTSYGSYIFHNDFLHDLPKIWQMLVQDLLAQNRTFQTDDFERFAKIIVGLWSCKPKPSGLKFDEYKAATTTGLTEVDKRIEKQMISSDALSKRGKRNGASPLTDVVHINSTDTIRNFLDIDLFYLTPQQKCLLDQHRRIIVTGAAGTGKSLMMLIKVIELVKKRTCGKILVVAPFPFLYKCINILCANNISTTVLTKFPTQQPTAANPPHHPNSDVVLMKLNDFFNVDAQTLLNYDLEDYSIFIDDMQAYVVPPDTNTWYPEIAEFLIQTHTSSARNNYHLWLMIDVLQSEYVDLTVPTLSFERFAYSLLFLNAVTPRPLPLPIFNLSHILRNTYEITQLLKHAREHKINELKVPSLWTTKVSDGHRITCRPVTYHKLQQGVDRKHKGPFVLLTLNSEITALLNQKPQLPREHVAVLIDSGTYGSLLSDIKQLFQTLNITTQSTKDSLTAPQDNAIILDIMSNCSSMEYPCVIFICCVRLVIDTYFYTLAARARSNLIVIHHDITNPPINAPHLQLITWNVDANGQFTHV